MIPAIYNRISSRYSIKLKRNFSKKPHALFENLPYFDHSKPVHLPLSHNTHLPPVPYRRRRTPARTAGQPVCTIHFQRGSPSLSSGRAPATLARVRTLSDPFHSLAPPQLNTIRFWWYYILLCTMIRATERSTCAHINLLSL